MGFEIINTLKKEKGITNAQLAEYSGITLSTIDKITSGINTNPKLDTLLAICRVLGCSLNDFANQPVSNVINNSVISHEELEYIKKYRALDHYGKNTVSVVLDSESARCKEQNALRSETEELRAVNIIPFRCSLQPASAGRGTYLGPEEFDILSVVENSLTKRASFGVPVSGDSMEPLYHDEDILIIEKAEDVAIGEIGLFTIDGEGYVKKRGKEALISLNPNYEPIPLTENSFCNGKVIGILEKEWIM